MKKWRNDGAFTHVPTYLEIYLTSFFYIPGFPESSTQIVQNKFWTSRNRLMVQIYLHNVSRLSKRCCLDPEIETFFGHGTESLLVPSKSLQKGSSKAQPETRHHCLTKVFCLFFTRKQEKQSLTSRKKKPSTRPGWSADNSWPLATVASVFAFMFRVLKWDTKDNHDRRKRSLDLREAPVEDIEVWDTVNQHIYIA